MRDGNLGEIVCPPCIQTASNGMICCTLNQDILLDKMDNFNWSDVFFLPTAQKIIFHLKWRPFQICALFYLWAGGYEQTIKKMLKLMAGRMTSLAPPSQFASKCKNSKLCCFKKIKRKYIHGLNKWNNSPSEDCDN